MPANPLTPEQLEKNKWRAEKIQETARREFAAEDKKAKLIRQQAANLRRKTIRLRENSVRKLERFPYLAQYRLPTGANIQEPQWRLLPGLLFYQVVVSEDADIVISLWESETAYKFYGKQFIASVRGSNMEASLKGLQRVAGLPDQGWMSWLWGLASRQFGIVAACLALAAGLLSHVDAIVDVGSQYVWSPEVQIEAAASALPITKGKSFSTQFEVQNLSSFASCWIEIDNVSMYDTAGSPVSSGLNLDEFSSKRYPLVKPAETKNLTVSGRAITPGQYQIRIEGHYRHLHRNTLVPLSSSLRPVRVWDYVTAEKAVPKGLSRQFEPYHGNRWCRAFFQVRTGREYQEGLTFAAQMDRVAGVKFRGVQLADSGKPEMDLVTLPGKEVAKIEWQSSKSFEEFEEVAGVLLLEMTDESAIALTDDQWASNVKKIKFAPPKAVSARPPENLQPPRPPVVVETRSPQPAEARKP